MSEDFELLKKTGIELFEKGAYEDALKSLSSARDLKNDDFTTLYYLGSAAYLTTQFQLASETLQTATKLNHENTEIFFDLGLAFEKCENFEEAEKAFNDALSLDMNHVDGLHHLGICQIECNRAAEAVQSLKKASQQRPEDMKIHFDLARAYLKSGERKQAMRERQIIELTNAKLGNELADLIAQTPAQNKPKDEQSSASYNPF